MGTQRLQGDWPRSGRAARQVGGPRCTSEPVGDGLRAFPSPRPRPPRRVRRSAEEASRGLPVDARTVDGAHVRIRLGPRASRSPVSSAAPPITLAGFSRPRGRRRCRASRPPVHPTPPRTVLLVTSRRPVAGLPLPRHARIPSRPRGHDQGESTCSQTRSRYTTRELGLPGPLAVGTGPNSSSRRSLDSSRACRPTRRVSKPRVCTLDGSTQR